MFWVWVDVSCYWWWIAALFSVGSERLALPPETLYQVSGAKMNVRGPQQGLVRACLAQPCDGVVHRQGVRGSGGFRRIGWAGVIGVWMPEMGVGDVGYGGGGPAGNAPQGGQHMPVTD